MTLGLPEGSALPGTRAELLTAQRAEVTRLDRSYFSVGRALRVGPWLVLILIAGPLTATWLDDDPGASLKVACLAGFVAIVAAVGWRLMAHAASGRALRTAAGRWHDVDRTPEGRSLPPGDIDAEVATIHDARDRPDLAEVIRDLSLRQQVRITDMATLGPAILAVFPGVIGLALILGALLGDYSAAATVVLTATGAVVMVPALVVWWTTTAEAWRRQQDFNRTAVERELYLARRTASTGEETAKVPTLPAWARPLAALVMVGVFGALVVLLVVRLGRVSSLAIFITAAILLVVAAISAVPLARRRSLHVVPLLAGGGTVVGTPMTYVRLELADSGLRILPTNENGAAWTIRADEVLAVVPVTLNYPFAPDAIGIITKDAPVVLAGRGIAGDQAIRGIQSRLAGSASR